MFASFLLTPSHAKPRAAYLNPQKADSMARGVRPVRPVVRFLSGRWML